MSGQAIMHSVRHPQVKPFGISLLSTAAPLSAIGIARVTEAKRELRASPSKSRA